MVEPIEILDLDTDPGGTQAITDEAPIMATRITTLMEGKDRMPSLLCYLDLPAEKSDHSAGGEILELTKGKDLRTWENHEFRCTEMATSVTEPGNIILTACNLKRDQPYTIGLSWWHGLRNSNHPDLVQSVFVEFEDDSGLQRLPLLEIRTLPRFDGVKKQDVEQVDLSLPTTAVRAGNLRIVVENVADKKAKNVYLSEVWLRDGRLEPSLGAVE